MDHPGKSFLIKASPPKRTEAGPTDRLTQSAGRSNGFHFGSAGSFLPTTIVGSHGRIFKRHNFAAPPPPLPTDQPVMGGGTGGISGMNLRREEKRKSFPSLNKASTRQLLLLWALVLVVPITDPGVRHAE